MWLVVRKLTKLIDNQKCHYLNENWNLKQLWSESRKIKQQNLINKRKVYTLSLSV